MCTLYVYETKSMGDTNKFGMIEKKMLLCFVFERRDFVLLCLSALLSRFVPLYRDWLVTIQESQVDSGEGRGRERVWGGRGVWGVGGVREGGVRREDGKKGYNIYT